jgi:hypothetical protein
MAIGSMHSLAVIDASSTIVGSRELADLQASWDEYHSLMSDLKNANVMDPTIALRKSGAVLRAVRGVLASASAQPVNSGLSLRFSQS